ncbi:HupE/UreJ family protein [Microbulbifer hainanensis]|uniref:HupE/UreJ family protein n=1 Tax=Microbulbifer hainanensis TaxID=2735675 RepID=UPI001865C10D|nr:HupE/UreJ family protein [Microbulbifer hainanensis]
MSKTLAPILLLFTLLLSPPLFSHELRPAYLQIEQTSAGEFAVTWRVPARGELRLAMNVRFDDSVVAIAAPQAQLVNGFYAETWKIRHAHDLAGVTINIDGLQQTMTDALARITWLDGREQVLRLLPDQPQFTVDGKAGNGQVAGTYFALGVEHILLGIDHLLFVLALILLVTGGRQLLGTITAFTLAHSITLAAAVLGIVSVHQAPVEAVIALSIVFVATEILHKLRGRSTLAIRKPWLVAFGFGLLHGLGFAGALADIGVPQDAIPLSLAMFNIGVEAGQLLFIVAVTGLFVLFRRLPPVQQWQQYSNESAAVAVAWPVSYLVGGLAAWWLIERTVSMMI